MKKLILVITSLFCIQLCYAENVSPENIKSYGVYINSENGYQAAQRVKGVSGLNTMFARRVLTLPAAKVEANTLEVVIFNSGVNPNWIEAQLRSFESPDAGIALTPDSVTPLADDKFLISYNIEESENRFVAFDIYCCGDNVFAMALTPPKQAVLEIYGKGTQHNPVSAEYVVGNMLKGTPEDADIKALHSYWINEVTEKEANSSFQFLMSRWEEVEAASNFEDKARLMKSAKSLAERYLESFPQARDHNKVRELLASINKKEAAIMGN